MEVRILGRLDSGTGTVIVYGLLELHGISWMLHATSVKLRHVEGVNGGFFFF